MAEPKKTARATFDVSPAPPVAARRPFRRTTHGRTLDDPYAWLAAENWREVLRSPEKLPADIAALLEAENAYCEKVVAPLAGLRKTLVAELRGRIQEDDADVPDPDGPYAYYGRFRDGAEHPLACRTPRDGGPETILLDGEALAEGHDFFDIGDVVHSPDHAQLAWSVDDMGSELYAIRTRAIADGTDRADVVTETDGSVVWSADSRAFYYVRVDENHRTAQVFRHEIGADPATDRLVIEEPDGAWFVSLDESRCRRFAVVSIHGHDASECWLVDLRDADAVARLVAPREAKLRYEVEPHGDLLYVLNNADGAEDFRISVAPLASPERANWRDAVPHRDGAMIVAFTAYRDFLVWLTRENSLPRLLVRNLGSGEEHVLAFEEEAYALGLEPGLEFDTSTLRFT
jgi:oligopeptidase B